MYVPDLARVSPSAAGLSHAEEVMLTTADSERLVAWHVAPQSDRPVILYLQGNGGALRHRVRRFAQLVQDGFGVVAISYRGFGGSTGSPSETGLLLDAAAGYVFCTDHYAAERIVVWGESLGTGVAVALASKQPVGRLILEAPFTSAAEVAQLSYPLIPVSLLMKDQFRSDARIGAITIPTLVLHGELRRTEDPVNQTGPDRFSIIARKHNSHERKEGLMLRIPLSILLVGTALFVVRPPRKRTPLQASSLPSNPRISGAHTR